MGALITNPSPSMGEGQGWGCAPAADGSPTLGTQLYLTRATSARTPIPTLPPSRGKGLEALS